MNIPRYTLKALPYEESDEGAAGAVIDAEASDSGEWCKWEDVDQAWAQREREIGETDAWMRLMLTQAAEIGRTIKLNKPFDAS